MSTHDERAALMVEHWGERIVRHRKSVVRATDGKPWSQQDLADALGTDQAQVSKWERGIQEPKLATKYAIAEALGVSADVLFPTYP